MTWDLGWRGVGLLLAMSAGFGLLAQLVLHRWSRWWTWLAGAAAYFLSGLFVSEVWFGWATEEDLQPNVDGLSFDEVLLITTLPGVASVLLLRHYLRGHQHTRAGPRHLAR